MRIKKLSLQGYKTFATKTEFLFDTGITAVVGPNGSGKSNIADALRWVLGEQSYNALRGKRTTDMIFTGSQSRPRAGMAQAILTLDNSDGWLPIDYTEVEIGRRAYRSGENEYILNGQKVRLKDVSDLLATSGLAERTYTIIGQGLVDRALSLRAEERRALFEEAAGIHHYKSRRAETLRRLQDTQHNLQRVHDILAEIQPRLVSLKRQASRARNFEQIHADLQQLLLVWYGYKWEQGKKALRTAKETAVASEQAWQQHRRTLRVYQENADELRRRIHRLEEQINSLQTERDATRDQLETARREAAVLDERRQSLARRLAEVEADLPSLEQQTAVAQADLATATADLAVAQEQWQNSRNEWQQFNTGFEQIQAQINQLQTEQKQARQQQQTVQNRISQTQGQLNQLRQRLQEQAAQQEPTDQLQKLQTEIDQLTAVWQKQQQEAANLRQQRDTAVEQRQTLIRQLKQLRQGNQEKEQQINRRRRDLVRLETKADMLDQMRLKEAPISPDVPVLGSLAALMTVPAAYETAVAAALQTRLGTWLLPDENSLWAMLKGQNKPANLAALTLSDVALPEPIDIPDSPGVIGWAAGLVDAPAEAQTAVQLLLGQILLVQDAQTAYRLGKSLPAGATAVSLDGFVAHAGGLVETGGSQSSLLARAAEWRQTQAELNQLKTEITEMETAVAEQQQLIQAEQNKIDALQNEEAKISRLLSQNSQQTGQNQRDLDRQRQQYSYLERQQQNRSQESSRLQSQITTFEAQIETDQASLLQLEQTATDSQNKLLSLPVSESQQQRQALQQAVSAAQTIVAGRQAVVDSRRATLNQFAGQLDRLKERHAQLQQEQTAVANSTQEQDRLQLHDQLAALDEKLAPLRARLAEARADLAQDDEKTAVVQKTTHDAETAYTQARITLTQRQTEIENLQERLKTDLGMVALPYDDDQTGQTPLPIDGVQQLPIVDQLPADIEKNIQDLRGQMQRMGAINPDAPEEYEAAQERFDFLSQQVADLNETEAQLRKVITELDDLTSRAFAETVEKVNAVFSGTFTQLFGGGAGRLVLTDPDDLTITGVDIVARLPNRREQSLGLLSGGERSLTAVALIFSLLKVAPTPFCVLDEVDAALDEANVTRFRDLLQELAPQTQFIVITHNRGTVQAAQTIYGISMGTDSASQAISIRPEDYVKQETDSL